MASTSVPAESRLERVLALQSVIAERISQSKNHDPILCRQAVLHALSSSSSSSSLANPARRCFVGNIKKLAGRRWRSHVHEEDIEFLYDLLERKPARLAERIFPPAEDKARADLRMTRRHSSRHEVAVPTLWRGGPRDTSTTLSTKVVVREGPIHAAQELKKMAVRGDSRHRSLGAVPAVMLLRCWPARSLLPVPSLFTGGAWFKGNGSWPSSLLALAATQAPAVSESTGSYACRPLHRSNAAGRVDGRAIPIVTPVLQSSGATGEFVYVSGTTIVADPARAVAGIQRAAVPSEKQAQRTKGDEDDEEDNGDEYDDNDGKDGKVVRAQQRQRRFHGHEHAVTAFSLSPCGRFVASASVGRSVASSVLLVWRLRDGKAAMPSGGGGAPGLEDHESDSSDMVIAEGCFPGGVGAMDWSLDGRQLVTVARDDKNLLRVFHLFPASYAGIAEDAEAEPFASVLGSEGSGHFQPVVQLDGRRERSGNKRLAEELDAILRFANEKNVDDRPPSQLFAATTLVGLPPIVRAVGWTGAGQFVSVGEKGHTTFWTFSCNDKFITDDAETEICNVQQKSGSGISSSGDRAVMQCFCIATAALPPSLPIDARGCELTPLKLKAQETTAEGFGRTVCPVHLQAETALVVTGATDGTLFLWDNPETLGAEGTAAGTIDCVLRWEGAHAGAGGDGRKEAAPFRGAVDGITAVQTLAITTTATLNETRFTNIDDQIEDFADDKGFVRRVLEISQVWTSTCAGRPASAFNNTSSRATNPTVVVREETEEEVNQTALDDFHTCEGSMEVSAIFVSGGSDGKVRLWRAVAFFRLVRRIDESSDDNFRPWSIQRSVVAPTSVPGGAKSGSHVLLESLRALDIKLGQLCCRDLLPMNKMDQERRKTWPALHGIQCGRPWGVKAIGVDTSKVSKQHTGRICDAIISSSRHGGPNFAGFPPTSLALDVATVGGLSIKINLASDMSYENPLIHIPTNLRGKMITTAGHFQGPGLGMEQHPTLAGLYFTIAADKTICTWQLRTEATGRATVEAILSAAASNKVDMEKTDSIETMAPQNSGLEGGEQQLLIACLPLKRSATAIAVSPQILVERRDDEQPTVPSIFRVSVLLAVGFEDGQTGEFILELNHDMASSPFLDAIGWEEMRTITLHGRCFTTKGQSLAEFVADDGTETIESFLDTEAVTALSYGPPPTTQLATRSIRSPAGILLAIGYRGMLRVLRSFDLFREKGKRSGGSGCFQFLNHGAEVISLDWSEIQRTLPEPWFEPESCPPLLRMRSVLRSVDRSHAIFFHEFKIEEKTPVEEREPWECWSIRKPKSASDALQFRDEYFPSSSARVGFQVAGIWSDDNGRAKVASAHSCGTDGSGFVTPLGGFDSGFGADDDTALNVVGLEDGTMKIFKAPTIAVCPIPVFTTAAHVSRIISIRSAFIPKKMGGINETVMSADPSISSNASLIVATFGASDTVLALWEVWSCKAPLLPTKESNNVDIGPLGVSFGRLKRMQRKDWPQEDPGAFEQGVKQSATVQLSKKQAVIRKPLKPSIDLPQRPRLFIPTEYRKEGTKPYAIRSVHSRHDLKGASPGLDGKFHANAEGVDLDHSELF